MIIYVSGTYDYLYIHESYVNLIWYLYLFLLNKLCPSLSLSESESESMSPMSYKIASLAVEQS